MPNVRARIGRCPAGVGPGLLALAYAYFFCLLGLTLLRLTCGDRWSWLFVATALTPYYFLPLPLLPGIAWVTQRRTVWAGAALGLLGWASLYGGLFFPRPPALYAATPTLTVMTYNLLGPNKNTPGILASLRASEADIIALEELSPRNAAAIRSSLAGLYPYQILDPRPGGVPGSGVISRYPLQPTGEALPGVWQGTPQVLRAQVAAQAVTFIQFHAVAGPEIQSIRAREMAAQALAGFAQTHTGPLIAAGDLNATDMSVAYRSLQPAWHDTWREVGYGLGHTFPGAASPDSARPSLGPIYSPMWLVRIDYILHSKEVIALSARLGVWEGDSDHRPVVAELAVKP